MNIIIYDKTVLNKKNKPILFLDKCSFTRKGDLLTIKFKIPLTDIVNFSNKEIIGCIKNQIVGHSFIFIFDYGTFSKSEELNVFVDDINEKDNNYFEFICLIK